MPVPGHVGLFLGDTVDPGFSVGAEAGTLPGLEDSPGSVPSLDVSSVPQKPTDVGRAPTEEVSEALEETEKAAPRRRRRPSRSRKRPRIGPPSGSLLTSVYETVLRS